MEKRKTRPRWRPLMSVGQAQIARGVAATALGLAISSNPAWAQSSNAEAGAEAAQSANSDLDIVVTAQRREQRIIDVPISMQAKSGEALAAAGITDGSMLEQISPALSFSAGYNAASTSLSIRGVSSVSSEGGLQPSVGVVVDGMPLARQAEVLTDLGDIERVEVLSGPQGTLFGKNSTAGVVNILTKQPEGSLASELELTGTSDQEILVKGMINTPITDIVALRTAGYYHYLDPLAENLAGKDLLGQRSYGARVRLLISPDSPITVLLTGTFNNNHSSFGASFVSIPLPGLLGEVQRQQNPTPDILSVDNADGKLIVNQNTPSFVKMRSHELIAEVNSDLSDSLKLTSVTGYRKLRFTNGVDVDAGPNGGAVGSGLRANPAIGPLPDQYPIGWYDRGDDTEGGTYEYWSQELRLALSEDDFDIVGGLFYQDYQESRSLRQPLLFDGSFAPGDPALAGITFLSENASQSKISDKTFAAFGDVTIKVLPSLSIFGGLRYTYEKVKVDYHRDAFFTPVGVGFDPVTGIVTAPPISTLNFGGDDAKSTENELTGRAGIQYQPDRDTNIYASYSRGYKGPAVNQTTGLTGPANAIIDPETAEAYEIGAKLRMLDGKLGLDLAFYSQKIRNIQQASIRPNTVIPDLVNAGDLKTKGFELNINARPLSGLQVNLGVVYNDAAYTGGVVFNCGPTLVRASACPDNPNPGFQIIDGKQAIGVPKWKLVSSADYEFAVGSGLKMGLRVGYNWKSNIQYTLFHDPLTLAPKRGDLDASISIGADDDSWQFTIFGRNLTDSFYFSGLNTVSIIGDQSGQVPRDFHRYVGIKLNYRM